MKRSLLLVLPLLFAACAQKPDRVELTDWQFEYNGQWYPATVPGFIHTDLMANGIIPDPYYGTNEDSVQWVSDSVWFYKTTLACCKLSPKNNLRLVFKGLAGNTNVICTTVANGKIIECISEIHNNMFTSFEVTLPSLRGADSLIVDVIFNPLQDTLLEESYGIPLPDRRAFTRIAPYQQGWDWGPKLTTCGIWKSVYITNVEPQQPRKLKRKLAWNDTKEVPVYLADRLDSIGKAFAFRNQNVLSENFDSVVFMKGANWIPAHSFPVMNNEMRDRYRMLLCAAKEANFNMIRVWGGGIYEHDYFFDLCDSLGLMVWMDFNFSTMLYPDDDKTLASINEEAIQNVARIMRHPCIVLWCGNNEVQNGWEDWGWQDVYRWTPEQRARLQHGIDTIFGENGILAKSVSDYDWKGRRYITTSPLYGWGHPECTTHGDSHYWGVWWGEEPFEKYKEKTGRFMSEYGFQSYPMLSTIRQFCPEEQLSIDSPTLRSHQKHGRGREIIDKAMRQYYGFDSHTLSLEDYCYVSQLLQAWGTGYGIFCHISAGGTPAAPGRCAGTLYWQLNDCWPVASWSSIDYYGNWKALHYRVQALYQADSGKWKEEREKWEQYYSVYPKDRTYPNPKYTLSVEGGSTAITVTVKAETDLYDVYIETTPHINGHFTRNFFDLRAGESVTTTLIPADPKADLRNVKVTAKTLNDLYRHN